MNIVISLKRGSSIDNAWRRQNRVGGEIEGMKFRLQNNVYVGIGTPLPGALEKFTHNPSVLVEMTSVSPPRAAEQSLPRRRLHGGPR